ncbi:MAG TPA: hypothetical protein VMV69_00925 [Pirellulales bacterium]|nr:hypothetical protein [Pirellulales bacterium]
MPRILEAEEFSANNQPEVADFFCGNEPWELAIADWIVAKENDRHGALWPMKHRQTRIWLFYDGDAVVGYGSIGTANWSWPFAVPTG